MTFPSSFGRRPRRPVVERQRRRGPLLPTVIVLFVLVLATGLFARVATDIMWFDQLGFLQIYRTRVLTQAALFVLGALIMAAAVAAALVLAYRSRPIYAPMSSEQAGLDRYRDSVEPLRRVIGWAVPVVLGLFAGSAAMQRWETVLLWWNRVPFGTRDPQFHLDVGFFVFSLPWLRFLSGYLSAVVVLAGIASLVTHYLYGGLRLSGTGERTTHAARIHLALLGAAFILLRGISYWLDRYALSTRESTRITGLTWTDVNVVLTVKAILTFAGVIAAVLFVAAAFGLSWRIAGIATSLLVVVAIVAGGILPGVVQALKVKPSEQSLEAPYIERNIQATRAAYGLDKVKVTQYDAATETSAGQLRNDAATVPGIRLLDPARVSDTFRQLQQNKQYYSFADALDVDRYQINGQSRDTVIAARELHIDENPPSQRNWVNDHTVYTHGFGVVAAYGNRRAEDGKPVFFEGGIPSTGALGAFEPRIYFGERTSQYSIVGAPSGTKNLWELDYPDTSPSGQANTAYAGDGGVPVGSFWRKALFAIKFREENILLSNRVTSASRIMYDRQPRARVEKVAPWLTLDGDPYPAVVDGRVQWIIDGYTTTAGYPYSSLQTLDTATRDSLTATSQSVAALQPSQVNYIRNSVKATVDAYDGAVRLYAWDAEDPLLKAWSKAFPRAVRPMSEISGDLMSHLRYPEDLFKVQRQLLASYHVTDPSAYFGGQDFWNVPNDPTQNDTSVLQPPYYLSLAMPGQRGPAFSLTTTYIPRGTAARNVLTGFLAVDADAGRQGGQRNADYGTLRLLELPKNSAVPGPGQTQAFFRQNADISRELNVLTINQTQVVSGNLLTLPVGGGLLYVQPVYVRGAGDSSYPLLQKVLVAFGDKVGFADTLDQALDQVFGGDSGAQAADAGAGPTPSQPGGSGQPGGGQGAGQPAAGAAAQAALTQALADASKAISDGQAALAKQDFAGYGAAQKRLDDAVRRAVNAEAQVRAAQSTATPRATPTPSPSVSPSGSASGSASAKPAVSPSPVVSPGAAVSPGSAVSPAVSR